MKVWGNQHCAFLGVTVRFKKMKPMITFDYITYNIKEWFVKLIGYSSVKDCLKWTQKPNQIQLNEPTLEKFMLNLLAFTASAWARLMYTFIKPHLQDSRGLSDRTAIVKYIKWSWYTAHSDRTFVTRSETLMEWNNYFFTQHSNFWQTTITHQQPGFRVNSSDELTL